MEPYSPISHYIQSKDKNTVPESETIYYKYQRTSIQDQKHPVKSRRTESRIPIREETRDLNLPQSVGSREGRKEGGGGNNFFLLPIVTRYVLDSG